MASVYLPIIAPIPAVSTACGIVGGLFRGLYNMGKNGDEAAMENFIGSTLSRDPYLKACHDFVKYELAGEDVGDF